MNNSSRKSDEILESIRRRCLELYKMYENKKGMCPAIFDGYFCWPPTTAGELATQPCSGVILKSIKKGFASKKCTENATWLIPENRTTPWSNLTQCGPYYIETNATQSTPISPYPIYAEWLPVIKIISYFGYATSIVSLILSICILMNIKRLHCARNKLHLNLFISFIMRAFMSILKDGLFVRGTALASDTIYDADGEPEFTKDLNYSWVCKAIISIRWYFIISNFMLMLMEGLYLHNLMFLKLFSDNHGVTVYCILGWGLPFLFVVSWIIAKAIYDNVMCWTQKDTYVTLLIDLPIGITVVINFMVFLIIVKVLFVKLNSAYIQQRKIKYRKLLRATLILIPLFGVPYSFSLLMSFYVQQRPILEVIWIFFDQSFAAFQGLFAALVYCLLNSEVRLEIKRQYSSMKDRNDKEFRRSRTISHTQQFSLQANEESHENIPLACDKENSTQIIIHKEHHCHF